MIYIISHFAIEPALNNILTSAFIYSRRKYVYYRYRFKIRGLKHFADFRNLFGNWSTWTVLRVNVEAMLAINVSAAAVDILTKCEVSFANIGIKHAVACRGNQILGIN